MRDGIFVQEADTCESGLRQLGCAPFVFWGFGPGHVLIGTASWLTWPGCTFCTFTVERFGARIASPNQLVYSGQPSVAVV